MITQRQIDKRKRDNELMIKHYNERFAVGDEVEVIDDDGIVFVDTIKHPATIVGGHTAMAWLVKRGSYCLERVISKAQPTEASDDPRTGV